VAGLIIQCLKAFLFICSPIPGPYFAEDQRKSLFFWLNNFFIEQVDWRLAGMLRNTVPLKRTKRLWVGKLPASGPGIGACSCWQLKTKSIRAHGGKSAVLPQLCSSCQSQAPCTRVKADLAHRLGTSLSREISPLLCAGEKVEPGRTCILMTGTDVPDQRSLSHLSHPTPQP
jgi:hypothetical protein